MQKECLKAVEVTAWYILVFVAIVGAIANTFLNRYFAISANKPPTAQKLLASIKETLSWTENPENTEGLREDVSPKAFCNFLGSCWPWEQKKLLSVWHAYHSEQNGVAAKAPLLRELLNLVKQYSGQT